MVPTSAAISPGHRVRSAGSSAKNWPKLRATPRASRTGTGWGSGRLLSCMSVSWCGMVRLTGVGSTFNGPTRLPVVSGSYRGLLHTLWELPNGRGERHTLGTSGFQSCTAKLAIYPHISGFRPAGRPLHIHCSHPTGPLIKPIALYEPDPRFRVDFAVRRSKMDDATQPYPLKSPALLTACPG